LWPIAVALSRLSLRGATVVASARQASGGLARRLRSSLPSAPGPDLVEPPSPDRGTRPPPAPPPAAADGAQGPSETPAERPASTLGSLLDSQRARRSGRQPDG